MQNNLQIHLFPLATTLAVTVAAFMLAVFFALRKRLFFAAMCLVCFFALLRPSVVLSAELCKPVRYADGDTFTFINADGDKTRVRLAGYDAPERTQPFSRVATNRLRELTEGGANCDCYKQDRHGRSVCTVRTLDGQNVAAVMLKAGLACIDPRFESEAAEDDRTAARAALEDAQANRRGMWSAAQPLCAFDYRRLKDAQR